MVIILMSKPEFVLFYLENISVGIWLLCACLFVVFIFIRKHIYSFFDPMFFVLLMNISSHSVVLFLYYFDKISFHYFLVFMCTQILFYFGWIINKPIKNRVIENDFTFDKFSKYLYFLATFLFITSQMSVYLVKGIPLFMEHRLDTFKGGGGFGIFGRVIFVTSTVSYCIAIFRLIYLKQKKSIMVFDCFVVLFFISSQVLSGSKIGILFAVFNTFIVMFFSRKLVVPREKEKIFSRFMLYLALIAIPFGVFTVLIQNGEDFDFGVGLTTVALRFINTGDIFYLAWVNNTVSAFSGSIFDGFLSIFSDFLGALRLYPRNELPGHLGLDIMWYVNGTDSFDGPNLRHNVFGVFHFGFYGAMFYSFFLGFFVGFIRNVLYFKVPSNIVGLTFYAVMIQIALYIPQDFSSLAMSYLFSTFLVFPFLLLLSFIFKNTT